MNTRPTPETNAFAIKFKTPCGEKYWVPVDIARKLERELAEARGQMSGKQNTSSKTTHRHREQMKTHNGQTHAASRKNYK